MSFFTAVLAADGQGWRAKDVDVEDCASLDDLAELMREVGHAGHPVVAIIEREDGWFGFVRVDGDEPANVFVSDFDAVMEGHYADLLGSAADLEAAEPGLHAYERGTDAGAVGSDDDDDEASADKRRHDDEAESDLLEALAGGTLVRPDPDPEPVDTWAGDPGVLADLGLSALALVDLVSDNPDDPASALAVIGEVLGFAELIEALR